jgi:kynurenine formamidase
MQPKAPPPISRAEFDALFDRLKNWGRWGADDQRGTLNYITPAHTAAAARLVRSGRTVSMSLPINTKAGPDNIHPAIHYMSLMHDVEGVGSIGFAMDFIGMDFHGDSHTHIDAPCHVSYEGLLYNGKPATSLRSNGATVGDITLMSAGVVGRGVLLDIPRLKGVKWLEPGTFVTADDLCAAEAAEDVRLGEGDIFLFRTGHHRRRLELGAWDPNETGDGRAGLDPYALELLHERRVSVFLPDGDGETVPGRVPGMSGEIHALQIVAMGMVCADSIQLEDVSMICAAEKRWEFMVALAPLLLPGGTGSPFNPIAIF